MGESALVTVMPAVPMFVGCTGMLPSVIAHTTFFARSGASAAAFDDVDRLSAG